jgi:hypothetical protein
VARKKENSYATRRKIEHRASGAGRHGQSRDGRGRLRTPRLADREPDLRLGWIGRGRYGGRIVAQVLRTFAFRFAPGLVAALVARDQPPERVSRVCTHARFLVPERDSRAEHISERDFAFIASGIAHLLTRVFAVFLARLVLPLRRAFRFVPGRVLAVELEELCARFVPLGPAPVAIGPVFEPLFHVLGRGLVISRGIGGASIARYA